MTPEELMRHYDEAHAMQLAAYSGLLSLLILKGLVTKEEAYSILSDVFDLSTAGSQNEKRWDAVAQAVRLLPEPTGG